MAIDGQRFDDSEDWSRLLGGRAPGDTVTLTVQPLTGTRRTSPSRWRPLPDDPNRGVIGVTLSSVVLSYDFLIDVKIDTGDVGGLQYLAFTLALLDDLTPAT